jgi:hypothetical protein
VDQSRSRCNGEEENVATAGNRTAAVQPLSCGHMERYVCYVRCANRKIFPFIDNVTPHRVPYVACVVHSALCGRSLNLSLYRLIHPGSSTAVSKRYIIVNLQAVKDISAVSVK